MTDDFCDVYDFVSIKAAVEEGQQENTVEGIYDILDILLDGLDREDRIKYLQLTLAKNLGSNDNEENT
mgnify:CR=1 FL=1|jgi:hypothetical protein|tara:strand:- start:1801 stop:2004 length:204 start_codon:yes stop_codon:yes gene_type:complete